jgi:glycosyltransferase involved in cell wall biosynthesis
MANAQPIRASIVIPTRDKMSHLEIVLEALTPQMRDEVELILIFDGCTRETLTAFDRLRLGYAPQVIIAEQNVGRAAARNLGIQRARGEVVIFCDDDVIPCPDFVDRHVAGHDRPCVLQGEVRYLEYTAAEIAQLGRTRAADLDFDALERDAVRKGIAALRRLYRPIWDRVLKPISFLTTNVSVEREDLLRVGMFDEHFKGWGYEDIDLGYRLGAAGIPFRRDGRVVNYHVNHPVNRRAKTQEARVTLDYFLKKIEGDGLARVALVSYFRMATLLGKFQ